MADSSGMRYVEIGVGDLDRSEEFYAGVLGFEVAATEQVDGRPARWLGDGRARIRLVEVGSAGRSSGWDPDDLQCGIRHFGMKVADVDAWMARVAASGAAIATEPKDAFGGVRIAFFFDPDGAYLELVQGYVQHNNLWSAELAEEEVVADRDWDGSPRFDHVAVTVPDLAKAREFYEGQLGFGGVGQLVRDDDPRGFLITNLRAGPGVLEVFTYDSPTHRRDGVGEPDRLGLRSVGLSVPGAAAPGRQVGPGDVPVDLVGGEDL